PVFDRSISAAGAIALDSISLYSTFSGGGLMGWLPTTAIADSMDSTLTAIYDSALAAYHFGDSSLCYGQIDSILARLTNCFAGDTVLCAAVRNTLDSLCAAHAIIDG